MKSATKFQLLQDAGRMNQALKIEWTRRYAYDPFQRLLDVKRRWQYIDIAVMVSTIAVVTTALLVVMFVLDKLTLATVVIIGKYLLAVLVVSFIVLMGLIITMPHGSDAERFLEKYIDLSNYLKISCEDLAAYSYEEVVIVVRKLVDTYAEALIEDDLTEISISNNKEAEERYLALLEVCYEFNILADQGWSIPLSVAHSRLINE